MQHRTTQYLPAKNVPCSCCDHRKKKETMSSALSRRPLLFSLSVDSHSYLYCRKYHVCVAFCSARRTYVFLSGRPCWWEKCV